MPIVDHFRRQDRLIKLDANKTAQEVTEELYSILKDKDFIQ